MSLWRRCGTREAQESGRNNGEDDTPGGNAESDENEGVAGKAIHKTMKTKGEQN